MEKLFQKLDEIFKKYKVSKEEVDEVSALIAQAGAGELKSDAEDFAVPNIGGEDDDDRESELDEIYN